MSADGFRYVLDEAAFERWRRLPPDDQEQLLNFFRRFRDSPYYESPVCDFDATGRSLSLSSCGKYAVTHWTDHAVRQVKVLEITGG